MATDNHTLKVDDFTSHKLDNIFTTYQNIGHITILYHKNLIDEKIRLASQNLIIGIYKKYALVSVSAYTPTAFVDYVLKKGTKIEILNGRNLDIFVERG